jgi:hypothetical protein
MIEFPNVTHKNNKQPPVPRFPFVNHFFDVHVHLFDQAHQVKTG